MTRVLVKLRFWSFQVGPASRAWAAPHRAIEPALHPEPGDNSSSRQAQKRIPQGKLECFCTCSLYLVLPRGNKRSVMVVMF